MKITRRQLKQLIAEELKVGVPTASMKESGQLPFEYLQQRLDEPGYEFPEGPLEAKDFEHEISIKGTEGFPVWMVEQLHELTSDNLSELIAHIKSGPESRLYRYTDPLDGLGGTRLSPADVISRLERSRKAMKSLIK